jgi:hypothetical protein
MAKRRKTSKLVPKAWAGSNKPTDEAETKSKLIRLQENGGNPSCLSVGLRVILRLTNVIIFAKGFFLR